MSVRWRIYRDRDLQAEAMAYEVAAELARCATSAQATLAVPGGGTPAPCLRRLAGHDVNWARVTLMATDERWAPPSDPRSNEAMIREALAPRDPRFQTFWREGMSPEQAAPLLSAEVSAAAPLTVCVMGMGADMHCASLFPGADALGAAMAADAPEMLAIRAPGAPEPRVTLSARMLSAAGSLHLLITGEEKRAAAERALTLGPLEAPVGEVLRSAMSPVIHWAP